MNLHDIDFEVLHKHLLEQSNENNEISFYGLQVAINEVRGINKSSHVIVNENNFIIRTMIELGLIELGNALYKVIEKN